MGCLCLLPVQFQSFVTCDAEQVLHSKCCTASVARQMLHGESRKHHLPSSKVFDLQQGSTPICMRPSSK